MYINNIRFLIIMGCLLLGMVVAMLFACRGKSEYQKMLEKGGE